MPHPCPHDTASDLQVAANYSELVYTPRGLSWAEQLDRCHGLGRHRQLRK
uniref:Uncharacterized protein n=1 Tax=Pan troglodytes TaxID=9598 RepID=G2HJV5_PANTR|nr:hypothetical protein [Pan troglodytes]